MTEMATVWEPDGWGSRARIGLLTPHNDIVPADEFGAMAPSGVAIHVARVPLGWSSGAEPPPLGLDAVRASTLWKSVSRARSSARTKSCSGMRCAWLASTSRSCATVTSSDVHYRRPPNFGIQPTAYGRG
jgi:hypothetical protein